MKASAVRGAVLVGLTVIIGALILFRGLNDSPTTQVAASDNAAAATSVAIVVPPTVTPLADPAPTATELPFAQPAPATSMKHAPSEVTVQVANGSDVNGLAGLLTRRLQQRNYVMRTATNAQVKVGVSTVYYQEGYDGDAQEIIQGVFGLNIAMQPMPDPPPAIDNPEPGGVNILIIAGSDDLARS